MKDIKFEYKKLGDVAEYINGKSHESLVVKKSDFILINSKFISTSGKSTKFVSTSNLLAKKNDILIVLSDVPNGKAIGKTYIIEDELYKYAVNQRIGLLRANKNINPKYLNYFLCRNKYFLSFDDGNKQTNLRKNDVLSLMVPMYCLETQNQIASFLTSIDNIIEQYEEVVKNLADQKKMYLNIIFDIKKGQETRKMKEIATIYSGGTPKSTVKEYYDGDVPFLSISDINNKYLYKTKKNITVSGLENSSSKICKSGSLIYTIYATVGIPVITEIDVAIPQSVVSFNFIEEVNLQYIYYYFLHFKKYLSKYITTGTQPNISAAILLNFDVPFPSFEKQNKISNFLSELDNQIEMYMRLIEQYRKYKKYYLNMIFSEDYDEC